MSFGKHRKIKIGLGDPLLILLVLLSFGQQAWGQIEFSDPALLSNPYYPASGEDRHPQHATDGSGNWVAVWESDDFLGGIIGGDFDILIARSHDNGLSWSQPVALNSGAATDSGHDFSPQVATDGQGVWLVVWQFEGEPGAATGEDADIFFARSMDNGENWSDAQALNTNAVSDTGDDQSPDVTTDGAGNWIVAWNSDDSLGGTIGTDVDVLVAHSADDGLTWSVPEALNINAGSDLGEDTLGNVATDGLGLWVTVWHSDENLGGAIGTDFDILVARSTDNGANWSEPAALNTNAESDEGEDRRAWIATDKHGKWIAAWDSNDDFGGTLDKKNKILVSQSTDHAATWITPTRLNADTVIPNYLMFSTTNYYSPCVVYGGADTWIITSVHSVTEYWGSIISNYITKRKPVYARSDNGGTSWSNGGALSLAFDAVGGPSPTPKSAILAATDGQGTWVAVWDSDNNLDGLIGSDDDILFTRSIDNAVSWIPSLPMNQNANFNPDEDIVPNDYQPALAADGHGNCIAVWYSPDSLGDTIGQDHDILFARSIDSGKTWSDVTYLNSNAAQDDRNDRYPKIAVDREGNWITVWESSLGATFDVFFARSTDNGVSWSAPVALNCPSTTDSVVRNRDPQLATDGMNRWMVAWNLYQTQNLYIASDILFVYSDNNGSTWSEPVSLIENPTEDLTTNNYVVLATDGLGTWIAAWESQNSLGGTIGTDLDILVTQSTDFGANWTTPVPLNQNAALDEDYDRSCKIATDGQGIWLAVWNSRNSLGNMIGSDLDILFSRSSDNGVSWSPPVPLNSNAFTDSGSDSRAEITTDGQGHWFTVWASYDTLGGTIGNDRDVLMAVSADNGVSWSVPVPINTFAYSDSSDDLHGQLAPVGQGQLVAVWQSDYTLGGTIESDQNIFFATGTFSGDGRAFATTPWQLYP